MSIDDDGVEREASVQTTLAAIFFSMELSRSSWLITSLSPGQGEKMSRRSLRWCRKFGQGAKLIPT